MTKRELRILALKFIAKIVEEDTDMSDYESVSEEVIDEAYELCERLKEEAEEIEREKALLDDMYEQHKLKSLITPVGE